MLDWVARTPALLQIGDTALLPAPGQIDLAALGQQLAATARLGRRFELLVAALLSGSGRYQILAQDCQITAQGRTLGAPDLIVRDLRCGEIEHWELTVKFYLGLASGWLGPGKRDWLEQKAAHLKTRQLPLLARPEAQAWLATKGWQPARSRLCSRGILFGDGPSYPWLSPGHQQGQWFEAGKLPDGDWRALARWQWIATTPSSELAAFTGQCQAPIMVQDGRSGLRHMVVPAGWPNNEKGEP